LLLLVVDMFDGGLVEPSSVAIAQSAGAAATFPTQTPVPVIAARTEPSAYGVASRDMTGDSAILWTRTPDAADVMP
jgi:phosphodiesterase/alkaline phosphatase D-like protein